MKRETRYRLEEIADKPARCECGERLVCTRIPLFNHVTSRLTYFERIVCPKCIELLPAERELLP